MSKFENMYGTKSRINSVVEALREVGPGIRREATDPANGDYNPGTPLSSRTMHAVFKRDVLKIPRSQAEKVWFGGHAQDNSVENQFWHIVWKYFYFLAFGVDYDATRIEQETVQVFNPVTYVGDLRLD